MNKWNSLFTGNAIHSSTKIKLHERCVPKTSVPAPSLVALSRRTVVFGIIPNLFLAWMRTLDLFVVHPATVIAVSHFEFKFLHGSITAK
mgnify:CR=1 FL=1